MNINIKNLKKKYINSKDFDILKIVNDNFNIDDDVILYNNGLNNKVILLNDMKKLIKVNDIFNINKKKENITIILNPITLNVCGYFGDIKILSINEEGSFILGKNEYKFRMGDEFYLINDSTKNKIKRIQVCILKLKDVFKNYFDPIYIIPKKLNKKLINEDFYENKKDHNDKLIKDRIHPKTLVYIIQYTSSTNKKKTTILIGKDANTKNISGYNFEKSKFHIYFNEFKDEIYKKKSFIFPMLWYYAKLQYPQSKIIFL